MTTEPLASGKRPRPGSDPTMMRTQSPERRAKITPLPQRTDLLSRSVSLSKDALTQGIQGFPQTFYHAMIALNSSEEDLILKKEARGIAGQVLAGLGDQEFTKKQVQCLNIITGQLFDNFLGGQLSHQSEELIQQIAEKWGKIARHLSLDIEERTAAIMNLSLLNMTYNQREVIDQDTQAKLFQEFFDIATNTVYYNKSDDSQLKPLQDIQLLIDTGGARLTKQQQTIWDEMPKK